MLARDGVHCLCETRHTESQLHGIRAQLAALRAQGSDTDTEGVFGPVPTYQAAGVAMLAGPPALGRVREVLPTTAEAKSFRVEGRVALFAVTVSAPYRIPGDSGERVIYIFVVYGHNADRVAAERVLRAVERWASTLGGAPTFVVGDFNLQVPEEAVGTSRNHSELLDEWHCSGTFYDVARVLASARGQRPGPTTVNGSQAISRCTIRCGCGWTWMPLCSGRAVATSRPRS